MEEAVVEIVTIEGGMAETTEEVAVVAVGMITIEGATVEEETITCAMIVVGADAATTMTTVVAEEGEDAETVDPSIVIIPTATTATSSVVSAIPLNRWRLS